MAKFPALPLYTDAYLADTRHLTTLQHGAYLLLLMTAWRTSDNSLPNDDRILARYAGLDLRTWKNNRDAVLQFWRLDEQQKWRQGRLDDTRVSVEHISSVNSANGSASALKRKNRQLATVERQKNDFSTNQNHKGKEEISDDISPSPSHARDGDKTISSMSGKWSEWFEEFWLRIYPKNNGSKKRTKERFINLMKQGISHEIIFDGAKRYAGFLEFTKPDPAERLRYTQHGSTWLGGACWQTPYDIPASPSNPGGAGGDQPGGRKKSPHDVAQSAWAGVARGDTGNERD